MPDVLEDGGPGGNADAGTDEDGDFVLKDVFGGGTVRAVDANRRHLLALLERDFIHAHGIKGVVFFRLGRAGTESVGHGAGPVAHLAHVDADVGVEWAGGDGERMPLLTGYGGDINEEPLTGLVLHAWFGELEL